MIHVCMWDDFAKQFFESFDKAHGEDTIFIVVKHGRIKAAHGKSTYSAYILLSCRVTFLHQHSHYFYVGRRYLPIMCYQYFVRNTSNC